MALSVVWSSQTYAQTDIVLPTLIAPPDITLEASEELTRVDIGRPTILNGTSAAFRPTNNGLVAYPFGETDVQWSVADEAGNVVTANQTITILDTTLPEFDTSAALTYTKPVATDIFDVTVSCDPSSLGMLTVGTTTITCVATDANGNASYRTLVIMDIDTTPRLVIPDDMTVEADRERMSVEIGTASAADYTGVSIVPTNNALVDYLIGVTSVDWSATDSAGRTVTDSQIITVRDTIRPEFSATLSDVTVNMPDMLTAVIYDTPVATDAFDVTVVCNPPSGSMFPVGTSDVTCKAVDANGNASSRSFGVVITQIDQTPDLVIPPNVTVEADAVRTSVDIGTATATDYTGASIIPTNNALVDYPLGETIVEWTATDSAGNTVTKSQTITVEDTTPPKVTPVYEYAYLRTLGPPKEFPSHHIPKATDIFGATVSCNPPLDGLFSIGRVRITCVATDANGNTTNHSIYLLTQLHFHFIPQLKVPADMVVEAMGERTSVDIGTATAIDAFYAPIIPTNNAPVDYPVGVTPVKWTAIDEAGNTDTTVQDITVRDTIPPEFSTPPPNIVRTSDTSIAVTYDNPIATDIFRVTVSCDPPSQSMFPVGTTTVTCVATDPSDNIARSAFNVIVRPPGTLSGIIVPPDITVEATAERTPVNIGTATATDGSGAHLEPTSIPLTDYPVGVTMVEWSATDGEGNMFTDTQRITVIDTTDPVFTPTPRNIRSVSTIDSASVVYAPKATDIFNVSTVCTPPSESRFQLGSTTVTCTATDQNGNTASVSFMVTVVQSDRPNILLGTLRQPSALPYHHPNNLDNEESKQYHDEITVNGHRQFFYMTAAHYPYLTMQALDSAGSSINGAVRVFRTQSYQNHYYYYPDMSVPEGTYALLDDRTVIGKITVDGNYVPEPESSIALFRITIFGSDIPFYDGMVLQRTPNATNYSMVVWPHIHDSITISAQDSNGVSTQLGIAQIPDPIRPYYYPGYFYPRLPIPDGTYTLYGNDTRLGKVTLVSPSDAASGASGASGSFDPFVNPDVFDLEPYSDARCIIFSDSDLGTPADPADECIILPESAIPNFFPDDLEPESGVSGQGN